MAAVRISGMQSALLALESRIQGGPALDRLALGAKIFNVVLVVGFGAVIVDNIKEIKELRVKNTALTQALEDAEVNPPKLTDTSDSVAAEPKMRLVVPADLLPGLVANS